MAAQTDQKSPLSVVSEKSGLSTQVTNLPTQLTNLPPRNNVDILVGCDKMGYIAKTPKKTLSDIGKMDATNGMMKRFVYFK